MKSLQPEAASKQPELCRPTCCAVYKDQTCTLLANHTGKHTSGKGRQW